MDGTFGCGPNMGVPLGVPVRGSSTFASAILGTALLCSAASQVHCDRTHRIPVITFPGPLAEFFYPLLISGCAFSIGAIVCANVLHLPLSRLRNPFTAMSTIAMVLGWANLLATLIAWVAMHED